MNEYLSSTDVHVFPFGSTRTNDPASKVLNEQNIVNILKSIVDFPNYVISSENIDGRYNLKFVISGYYFDVKNVIRDENKPIYAGIKLNETLNYEYLLGSDDISAISGDGTRGDPYVLSNKFTSYVSIESDNAVYFRYEFPSSGNLRIAGDSDNLLLYLPSTSTEGVPVKGNSVLTPNVDNETIEFSLKYMNNSGEPDLIKITFTPSNATGGAFSGLKFSTEDFDGEDGYRTLLLVGSDGNIPKTSVCKFRSESTDTLHITCGGPSTSNI